MTGHGSDPDAELVARARAGDQQAMVDLWSRHYPAVLAAARRVARQPRDAEEMASDAFAGMLGALSVGRGPTGSVRAYLLTSVKNVAVTRARRASATDVLIDDMATFDTGSSSRDPVARVHELGLMRQAFSALPHRWQTVLWRTAVDRESNVTVGRELDLTPNAVAALARRARRGLRTAYVQAHVSQYGIAPGCEPYINRLADLAVNGDSAPADLRDHVDSCARCTERLAELRAVDANMAGVLGPAVLALLPATSSALGLPVAAASAKPPGHGAAATGGAASGPGGVMGGVSAVAAHVPVALGLASLVAGGLATVGLVGMAVWPHGHATASSRPTPSPTSTTGATGPAATAGPAAPETVPATTYTSRLVEAPAAPPATAADEPAQPAAPTVRPQSTPTGPAPTPATTTPSSPQTGPTTPAPASPMVVEASMTGRPLAVTTVSARADGTTGPATLTMTLPAGVVLAGSTGDWHTCSQAGSSVTCQAEHSDTGRWTGTVSTDWSGQTAGSARVQVSAQQAGGAETTAFVVIPWSSSAPLQHPLQGADDGETEGSAP